jgi:hypothetical protein
VPARQSLPFRVKKQVNDLLRRVTGYQFVKADKLEALESAAKAKTKSTSKPMSKSTSKPSARRR